MKPKESIWYDIGYRTAKKQTTEYVLELIEKELFEFADFVCKDIPEKDEESTRILIAMAVTRCKEAIEAWKGGDEE